MKHVLISAPYMLRKSEIEHVKLLLDKLPIKYDFADVEERLEESDLVKIIGDYQGIICGDDRFTENVYKAAKNLEVIVKWGTGIDSLNPELAQKYDIQLFRTPNAFTEPVSDSTLALMLSHCRNLFLNDRIIKEGGWDKPQGYTLSEKVIGLIGFGDIGRAVARKLSPFGCKIFAHDVAKFDDLIYKQHNVIKAELNDIFENCDIISLHCDLNSSSHHVINQNSISQMKCRPFIVNTARGPLIDEKALVEALNAGQISGAGLDVFEMEPLALKSPLRTMNNVVLSSHNTNSSPLCWQKVHSNSVNMLAKGLKI